MTVEPRSLSKAAASIAKDYIPAIGAVGLVLYGILRLAYVFFYLQLRTTPEEVGYGYSQILSESIAGALELTLLCAAAFLLLAVCAYIVRLVAHTMSRSPGRSGVGALRGPAPGYVRTVVARSLAAGAAVVLVSLPGLAWWQGGLARNGQTVRNVYFVGVPYLPVLAVRAVPADVAWVGGDAAGSFPLSDRECLMYLGQGNGTSVFYDARTRESLRLPAGNIVVSLRYTFFVPDSCR